MSGRARDAPSRLIINSMVFSTASVSGYFLFLDHLEAGHFLQRRGSLRMGLVVAVVVARPDIDKADRGIGGRCGVCTEAAAERQRGRSLQQMPS